MRRSKYEFIETEEQRGALRRVLDWWKRECRWGHDEPTEADPPDPPVAEKREGPGPLDPGELHKHGCVPKLSSPEPRYNRPGRPASGGPILSRTEVNRRYRARQKEIPCRAMVDRDGVQEKCGKPSWGGGLCETCYRHERKRLIPRLIEAQMAQEAQSECRSSV